MNTVRVGIRGQLYFIFIFRLLQLGTFPKKQPSRNDTRISLTAKYVLAIRESLNFSANFAKRFQN